MLTALQRSHPQFYPHTLIVDGNGRLHRKQFGLACHTGTVRRNRNALLNTFENQTVSVMVTAINKVV